MVSHRDHKLPKYDEKDDEDLSMCEVDALACVNDPGMSDQEMLLIKLWVSHWWITAIR